MKSYKSLQGAITGGKAAREQPIRGFATSNSKEPYLPLLSGILVYGIAFLPTCCALLCLTKILCKMREVLTLRFR